MWPGPRSTIKSGQFTGQAVQSNNSLNRTLGGLQLVAGANAVQEFDVTLFVRSWAEPVLTQVANLITHYESDPMILGT